MRKTVRHVQTLVRSRHLVIMWTGRTIKGRYQQSALGWLWAVIQPAATAALFTVVFTYIVPVNTGNTPYLAFSFAAVVPWTFLAMSLSDMSASLVTNMGLITKIYFPREILPIAAMCSRLMDFGLAFVVLGVLLLLYDLPPSLSALLYLPVIVGIQLILGPGNRNRLRGRERILQGHGTAPQTCRAAVVLRVAHHLLGERGTGQHPAILLRQPHGGHPRSVPRRPVAGRASRRPLVGVRRDGSGRSRCGLRVVQTAREPIRGCCVGGIGEAIRPVSQ